MTILYQGSVVFVQDDAGQRRTIRMRNMIRPNTRLLQLNVSAKMAELTLIILAII